MTGLTRRCHPPGLPLETLSLFIRTGESAPVGKDAMAVVADDATLGDRATMLYLGTSMVRGRARAVGGPAASG